MASTKKGQTWHFGLKAHIGSDPQARVDHVFGVIKHLWGYRRVRYRGLAKSAAHLFTLFALADWYLVCRELAGT